MTFVPNSSFYVTLMSHASTKEFPGNKSHHFRNRLPKPIRFVGRGWMVGMVSLSLPTIPVIAEEGLVGDSHPLLYVRWHERVYSKDDFGNDRWWHERRELFTYGRDMKKELASSTGSHFFINWCIVTSKHVRNKPNPSTNGRRTMASSCTRRLNGPQKGIWC